MASIAIKTNYFFKGAIVLLNRDLVQFQFQYIQAIHWTSKCTGVITVCKWQSSTREHASPTRGRKGGFSTCDQYSDINTMSLKNYRHHPSCLMNLRMNTQAVYWWYTCC